MHLLKPDSVFKRWWSNMCADSLGSGRARGKISTSSVSVLQKSQCCGVLQVAGIGVYSKHHLLIWNIYLLINLQWPLNPVSLELQSFHRVQQGHISGAFLCNELTFPRCGFHAAEPLHAIGVISPACWGLILYERDHMNGLGQARNEAMSFVFRIWCWGSHYMWQHAVTSK